MLTFNESELKIILLALETHAHNPKKYQQDSMYLSVQKLTNEDIDDINLEIRKKIIHSFADDNDLDMAKFNVSS